VLYGWLIWTVASDANRSRHSGVRSWGPLCLVILGCLLALLDITRHVLLDHGGLFFKEQTLAMYSENGRLSPAGKFSQISTIVGLTTLICGIVWFLDIPAKIIGKINA